MTLSTCPTSPGDRRHLSQSLGECVWTAAPSPCCKTSSAGLPIIDRGSWCMEGRRGLVVQMYKNHLTSKKLYYACARHAALGTLENISPSCRGCPRVVGQWTPLCHPMTLACRPGQATKKQPGRDPVFQGLLAEPPSILSGCRSDQVCR